VEFRSMTPEEVRTKDQLDKESWLYAILIEAKVLAIETQSWRPLRPNLKEFKWLRVFGPQCRVSIAMTFAAQIW